MNGLVDTLMSINNTTYYNNLGVNSLNYSRNSFITLGEIEH